MQRYLVSLLCSPSFSFHLKFKDIRGLLLQGGVGRPLTLTAYIVGVLLEEESSCSSTHKQNISTAVQHAIDYLIQNKDSSTFKHPYGLALYCYVLALHQPTSSITIRALER